MQVKIFSIQDLMLYGMETTQVDLKRVEKLNILNPRMIPDDYAKLKHDKEFLYFLRSLKFSNIIG